MTVFSKGKQITSIYTSGKSVIEAYSSGQLVFTTKAGWVLTGTTLFNITSANNNTIAGTITLNRYDYISGGSSSETYYELNSTSLSRTDQGVVEVSLPGVSTISIGTKFGLTTDISVPASGTIKLDAYEISSIVKLTGTGVIDLPSTQDLTSNYIGDIYDMFVTKLSDKIINVASGWAIANNRTSRLKLESSWSYSLASLNLTAGKYPVYALGESATEGVVSSIYVGSEAHVNYDNKLIRQIGWVTIGSDGNISSIDSFAVATTTAQSSAISGTSVAGTAGYALDSDGVRVYVPSFTYDYSDMITAAADTESQTDLVNTSASGSATTMSSSGYTYPSCTKTVSKSGPFTLRLSGTMSQSGGKSTDASKSVINLSYTRSDLSDAQVTSYQGKTSATWSDIEIPSGVSVTQVKSSGSLYVNVSISTKVTGKITLRAIAITTTEGTTQTRTLYAKVVRSQNNNTTTVTIQTTSADSTPFVSYVPVGTITVARNASTGTLS